jgi:hypothetical protein
MPAKDHSAGITSWWSPAVSFFGAANKSALQPVGRRFGFVTAKTNEKSDSRLEALKLVRKIDALRIE